MDSCGDALIGMVEGNGRERIRRVMWMGIIRFRCMIILGIVRGMSMMALGSIIDYYRITFFFQYLKLYSGVVYLRERD